MLRKLLLMTTTAALAYAICVAIAFDSRMDIKALPPLESGDLIFETTRTNQTLPIFFATASTITHVGVIHKQPDGLSVVQAAQVVIESSLSSFIAGGVGQRIIIRRYPGLTELEKDAIVRNAEHYLGRPYNYVFYMGNDQIYCSELPYLAYKEAGKPIGTLEKIGDLYVNNREVKKLFQSRWKMHPACQQPGTDYQSCWDRVMQEPIITPVNLARDSRLTTLYDNYPY